MIIGISGRIGSGKDLIAKIIQYWIGATRYNDHEEFRNDSSRDYSGSGWEIRKFAGKLKQVVSILTDYSIKDLEKESIKNSYLGPEWDREVYWTSGLQVDFRVGLKCESMGMFTKRHERMTVRMLLQELGTDAMRDVIHPNIHVNALFADYKLAKNPGVYPGVDFPSLIDEMVDFAGISRKKNYPNWIISDMRFPNEMEAVKQRGGITIRINRKYTEHFLPNGDTVKVIEHIPGFDAPKHPSETALDNAQFDYTINNDAGISELLEEVRKMLVHFKLINE